MAFLLNQGATYHQNYTSLEVEVKALLRCVLVLGEHTVHMLGHLGLAGPRVTTTQQDIDDSVKSAPLYVTKIFPYFLEKLKQDSLL